MIDFIKRNGAIIATGFVLGSLGLITLALSHMEGEFRQTQDTNIERVRHQSYDQGFLNGANAALKHAHVDGTNVIAAWADVLSEHHGPRH